MTRSGSAPPQRTTPRSAPPLLNEEGIKGWWPLRRRQDLGDCRRNPLPIRSFGFQMAAALGCQPVIPCPAIVIGSAPAGGDEPLILQSVERRIERTLLHAQDVLRDLLDALRDPP